MCIVVIMENQGPVVTLTLIRPFPMWNSSELFSFYSISIFRLINLSVFVHKSTHTKMKMTNMVQAHTKSARHSCDSHLLRDVGFLHLSRHTVLISNMTFTFEVMFTFPAKWFIIVAISICEINVIQCIRTMTLTLKLMVTFCFPWLIMLVKSCQNELPMISVFLRYQHFK